MNRDRIYVDGELYISLEAVAALYEVRAVWLREVFDFGLLGEGHVAGASVCVAAVQMDRVATVVRLQHWLGYDLEAISWELDDRSS